MTIEKKSGKQLLSLKTNLVTIAAFLSRITSWIWIIAGERKNFSYQERHRSVIH